MYSQLSSLFIEHPRLYSHILSVQKIEKKLAQQHSFYQNICHFTLCSPVYKNKIFYLTTFRQEPSAPHLRVIQEINFRPIEYSIKQDQDQMPVKS